MKFNAAFIRISLACDSGFQQPKTQRETAVDPD
jgi:hypothetical protein